MALTVNDELRKALDLQAGEVMLDEIFVNEIRSIVVDDTPLTHRVTRRNWPNETYRYRKHTEDPKAFWAADGAELNEPTNVDFGEVAVPMKYIYNRVEVTGPAQASIQALDIMAYSIERGARALGRKLENAILFGDSTQNPLMIDGIVKQIDKNQIDLAGEPLFLSHIDEMLDAPEYQPDTIAGSRAFGRRVNALLQAQQRFVDRMDVEGGFNVMAYRGAPIYTLDRAHGEELGNTVVAFNRREVVLAVQKDVFLEKLAKTKDSDDYMLGMYVTLAVQEVDLFHAKIENADFTIANV